MKWARCLGLIALLVPGLLAGCGAKLSDGEYDIEGEVVSLDLQANRVTIEHDDIPDGLKAGETTFTVEDPDLLDRIGQGNEVIGRFKAKSGKYIIINLQRKMTPRDPGHDPPPGK